MLPTLTKNNANFFQIFVFFRKVNIDELFVKCGDWDRKVEGRKPPQERKAKSISIHPRYVHITNNYIRILLLQLFVYNFILQV